MVEQIRRGQPSATALDQNQFVVVKVGSSSLTDAEGRISESRLERLAEGLTRLRAHGVQPVLVSSGAIASGRGTMERPGAAREDLTDLQALAAVGQGVLMATYAKVFASKGIRVAQVLLTAHEFGDRAAYLNTRATLQRLASWDVLPIINENDTTATQEITLGENDRLSALVATLLRAQLLIMLTDTHGIFEADPRLNQEAPLIEEVTHVDDELERIAGGPGTGLGSGGMATKLAAAKIASWSGIPCVIASADEPDVIVRAWSGESVGTRVRPRPERMPARKVWIAFARQPAGTLVVDGGAARAIMRSGASLLSVGIQKVEGDFAPGSALDIRSEVPGIIAKGITRLSSDDVVSILNRKTDPTGGSVVVHRDDMVVLARAGDN
jgi:glutamate 5-kinase